MAWQLKVRGEDAKPAPNFLLTIFIIMSVWFVKLHRKLLENPIASNPLLIWLFCYLLLLVSYKDHIFFLWKIRIEQKKWQAIISKKEIAHKFKISRWTLDSYLSILEAEHIISIKTTTKYTVLTIVNWCRYQEDDIKIASTWTSTWHQLEHQPDTIKKDNNNKEWKESIIEILHDETFIQERWLDILEEFVNHRSETDKNWKEKRQKQKTWDTTKRLFTWKKNKDTNFGRKQILDYEIVENFHRWAMANDWDMIKDFFRNKYKWEIWKDHYWKSKTKRKESDLFLETLR